MARRTINSNIRNNCSLYRVLLTMVRKLSITVIIILAVSTVGTLIFAYPYHWVLENRVNEVGVQNIIQAADRLDQIHDLPEEIELLKPVDILITDEGIYIQLDGFFVTAEGIFILRKSSSMHPENNSDPYYRNIEDRLYWYTITG